MKNGLSHPVTGAVLFQPGLTESVLENAGAQVRTGFVRPPKVQGLKNENTRKCFLRKTEVWRGSWAEGKIKVRSQTQREKFHPLPILPAASRRPLPLPSGEFCQWKSTEASQSALKRPQPEDPQRRCFVLCFLGTHTSSLF